MITQPQYRSIAYFSIAILSIVSPVSVSLQYCDTSKSTHNVRTFFSFWHRLCILPTIFKPWSMLLLAYFIQSTNAFVGQGLLLLASCFKYMLCTYVWCDNMEAFYSMQLTMYYARLVFLEPGPFVFYLKEQRRKPIYLTFWYCCSTTIFLVVHVIKMDKQSPFYYLHASNSRFTIYIVFDIYVVNKGAYTNYIDIDGERGS